MPIRVNQNICFFQIWLQIFFSPIVVGPGRLSNDDRRKIFPEIIIYTLHFSLCYDDLGVCAWLSQYGQRDQNKKAIRQGFEIRIPCLKSYQLGHFVVLFHHIILLLSMVILSSCIIKVLVLGKFFLTNYFKVSNFMSLNAIIVFGLSFDFDLIAKTILCCE